MVVAIDTNVLLDILEQRDYPASVALTADWVTDAAELVVTEQSHSELSGSAPPGAKSLNQRWASFVLWRHPRRHGAQSCTRSGMNRLWLA